MPERMRYGSLVELQESEGNIAAVTQVITESEGFHLPACHQDSPRSAGLATFNGWHCLMLTEPRSNSLTAMVYALSASFWKNVMALQGGSHTTLNSPRVRLYAT
jgi:hypothetical protein